MPEFRVIVANITKHGVRWKSSETWNHNYLGNHLRLIKNVNRRNVRHDERNNLLIKCFNLTCPDFELKWLI